MTRQEHLDWAKQRALEYVDQGDVAEAAASFISDMGKHKETADHVGLGLTFQLTLAGHLNTTDAMRKHIEGFN